MKYQEFQYWFHAFNTSISSLYRNSNVDPIKKDTRILLVEAAKLAADSVVDKMQTVEMPPAPEMPDLNSLVESVSKNITNKKNKI